MNPLLVTLPLTGRDFQSASNLQFHCCPLQPGIAESRAAIAVCKEEAETNHSPSSSSPRSNLHLPLRGDDPQTSSVEARLHDGWLSHTSTELQSWLVHCSRLTHTWLSVSNICPKVNFLSVHMNTFVGNCWWVSFPHVYNYLVCVKYLGSGESVEDDDTEQRE